MATAPDWTEEEKRRRQQGLRTLARGAAAVVAPGAVGLLSRGNPTTEETEAHYREGGIVGVASQSVGDTLGAAAQTTRTAAVPAGQVFFGERSARSLARTAPAAAAAPIGGDNDPNTPWPTVRSDARQGLAPGASPAAGLYRVVKTAPGVYTDDPNAQGEVRYYDQTGARADAPFAPSAGQPQPTSPRSLARWQNQNRFNTSDMDVQAQMIEQGAASLRLESERAAANNARVEALRRTLRPTEEQTALERTEMEQLGSDRRTAAENLARLQAAQIGAAGRQSAAQVNAQKALLDHDRWAREFAANPETAAAYMQQELGALENLSPAERRQVLTNPDNPQASRLRAMVRGQLAAVTGNPNVTPAQVQRAGGLRRFFTGNSFTDGSGWFGNGFSPSDLGMSTEQFLDFLNADQDVRDRW